MADNEMTPQMAQLNITWNGQNGDLPDPIAYDMSDSDVRQLAKEVVSNEGIPGVTQDANADFTDFVVDRYPATEEKPNRVMLRPKVPFGE